MRKLNPTLMMLLLLLLTPSSIDGEALPVTPTTDLTTIEGFSSEEVRFLITRADLDEILLMDVELADKTETISVLRSREDVWQQELTEVRKQRDRFEVIAYIEGGGLCVLTVLCALSFFF